MPARRVDEEVTACFPEPPLPEVMQLMGFALPDNRERQPPAALTAAAAGTGFRDGLRFHGITRLDRNQRKDNGSQKLSEAGFRKG